MSNRARSWSIVVRSAHRFARKSVGIEPLSLMTTQVTFGGLSGVLMTLGEGLQATELLVYEGMVSASHPTGEPLAVVREGESLTVWHDGDHKKKPIVPTPEEYAWNLADPLPKGWPVGRRDFTPQGMPYVRPEFWPDPYYQNTEMYQIRSPSVWLHGFFRLAPDSVIRVRYWVDRPGKGQVCFCAGRRNRARRTRACSSGMARSERRAHKSGSGCKSRPRRCCVRPTNTCPSSKHRGSASCSSSIRTRSISG